MILTNDSLSSETLHLTSTYKTYIPKSVLGAALLPMNGRGLDGAYATNQLVPQPLHSSTTLADFVWALALKCPPIRKSTAAWLSMGVY